MCSNVNETSNKGRNYSKGGHDLNANISIIPKYDISEPENINNFKIA